MDFSELLSLELCHFSNDFIVAFELNCVTSIYGSLKNTPKSDWLHNGSSYVSSCT